MPTISACMYIDCSIRHGRQRVVIRLRDHLITSIPQLHAVAVVKHFHLNMWKNPVLEIPST